MKIVSLCDAYSVIIDHIVGLSSIEHLAIPLYQPLWLGYLLLRWVAVEYIVISFTRWTRPYVGSHEPACCVSEIDR